MTWMLLLVCTQLVWYRTMFRQVRWLYGVFEARQVLSKKCSKRWLLWPRRVRRHHVPSLTFWINAFGVEHCCPWGSDSGVDWRKACRASVRREPPFSAKPQQIFTTLNPINPIGANSWRKPSPSSFQLTSSTFHSSILGTGLALRVPRVPGGWPVKQFDPIPPVPCVRCMWPLRVTMSVSMPGRRVAGQFWAQAVNQKKTTFTNRYLQSLHLRLCRSANHASASRAQSSQCPNCFSDAGQESTCSTTIWLQAHCKHPFVV